MAKTQYSFSTDPALMGAPSNHNVKIRELSLAAGAEFLVVVCGDIMRMPGLPRVPAANHISVNAQGEIDGLF
jgi:formate--tetrahydrofolate ligase